MTATRMVRGLNADVAVVVSASLEASSSLSSGAQLAANAPTTGNRVKRIVSGRKRCIGTPPSVEARPIERSNTHRRSQQAVCPPPTARVGFARATTTRLVQRGLGQDGLGAPRERRRQPTVAQQLLQRARVK